MKIKSLEDIKPENMENITASAVADFISEQIVVKDQEWQKQLEAEKLEKTSASEKLANVEKELEEIKSSNEATKKELDEIKAREDERERQEIFSSRMNEIDEAYELDENYRKVIAKSIRDLSDEAYAEWKTDFEVLASDKNKETIAAKKAEYDKAEAEKAELAEKEKADKKKEDESKASADEDKTEAEKILDEVKARASGIPNSIDNSEILEKYRAAFSKEDVTVTFNK